MNHIVPQVNTGLMERILPKVCVVLLLLAGGCASTEFDLDAEASARHYKLVVGEPVVTAAELHTLYLSDEVKAALDAHIDQRGSEKIRLQALRTYLFDERELNIRYDANATKTAMEIWQARAGNCLSMTNLFVAAARHVGLDAHFQTVVVRPTWDHDGATMVRYEHIVAVGRVDANQEYVVDFLPEFVIGDQRTRKISDQHALALYYNNLGAEAVIGGDYASAIHNLRLALQLEPEFSDAWNNMGAAQRRSGFLDLAEFSYRRALDLDATNHSALSNLAQLVQSQGRTREAEQYLSRVESYRARNPWFHYFVARYFFERGEFDNAIAMLERSIRLKRDEPEFYDALANAWVRTGNEERGAYYRARAEKVRAQGFTPPARMQNHRFWVQTISIN